MAKNLNRRARRVGAQGRVTGQELRRLYRVQKSCCLYTGARLHLGNNASLDHIVPLHRGGLNTLANICFVEAQVNNSKADTPLAEFCQARGLPLMDIESRIAAIQGKVAGGNGFQLAQSAS